jgi:hypothetical protein
MPRMKRSILIAILTSLLFSGCVTRAVWSDLDAMTYKTVAKDSLPVDEYAHLTEQARLENQDTIVLHDGTLRVRKNPFVRASVYAAQILVLPVTLPADIVVGLVGSPEFPNFLVNISQAFIP